MIGRKRASKRALVSELVRVQREARQRVIHPQVELLDSSEQGPACERLGELAETLDDVLVSGSRNDERFVEKGRDGGRDVGVVLLPERSLRRAQPERGLDRRFRLGLQEGDALFFQSVLLRRGDGVEQASNDDGRGVLPDEPADEGSNDRNRDHRLPDRAAGPHQRGLQ